MGCDDALVTPAGKPGSVTTDPYAAAGLLVIRVWSAEPGGKGFRARVTTTVDLVDGAEEVSTTTDPEVVLRLVADWLASMAATRR